MRDRLRGPGKKRASLPVYWAGLGERAAVQIAVDVAAHQLFSVESVDAALEIVLVAEAVGAHRARPVVQHAFGRKVGAGTLPGGSRVAVGRSVVFAHKRGAGSHLSLRVQCACAQKCKC